MDKHVEYKTNGVCSKEITFDIIDGKVVNVKFLGGCRGNTQGVAALAEGLTPEEIVKRLKGIQCRPTGASCPDQLARAVEENMD